MVSSYAFITKSGVSKGGGMYLEKNEGGKAKRGRGRTTAIAYGYATEKARK